jgi:hypothetical protein
VTAAERLWLRPSAEAVLRLARYRARRRARAARLLTAPASGRTALAPEELRLALRVDRRLDRLGVACLGRAVVVAEMLRARGVAAYVRLGVAAHDPRDAHAEVAVGSALLPGRVFDHVPLS